MIIPLSFEFQWITKLSKSLTLQAFTSIPNGKVNAERFFVIKAMGRWIPYYLNYQL